MSDTAAPEAGSCGTCRWWRLAEQTRRGECRRHAPQLVVWPEPDGRWLARSLWPRTAAEEGCGDFVPGFVARVAPPAPTPERTHVNASAPIGRPDHPIQLPPLPATAQRIGMTDPERQAPAMPVLPDSETEPRIGERLLFGVTPKATPERPGAVPIEEKAAAASAAFEDLGVGARIHLGVSTPLTPERSGVALRGADGDHAGPALQAGAPEGQTPRLVPDPETLLRRVADPTNAAKREGYPEGNGRDTRGDEAWRKTRTAFMREPPQPVAREICAVGAYYAYGEPGRPVLTVPAVLVDDDDAHARAWVHAELVRTAFLAGKPVPSNVRRDYPSLDSKLQRGERQTIF